MSQPFTSLIARLRADLQEGPPPPPDPRTVERLQEAARTWAQSRGIERSRDVPLETMQRRAFTGQTRADLARGIPEAVSRFVPQAIGIGERGLAEQQIASARARVLASTRGARDATEAARMAQQALAAAPLAVRQQIEQEARQQGFADVPTYLAYGDTARGQVGAGDLYRIARTEIPGAQRVADVAGELGRRAAETGLTVAQGPAGPVAPLVNKAIEQTPVPSPREAFGKIGEVIGESIVPTEVWMAALELVPGIGTVPDLVRAVKAGSPEAIRAVRTALRDERLAPVIRRAAEMARSESGMVRPEFFTKWRRDAGDIIEGHNITLATRGIDSETRASLKAEKAVAEEQLAILRTLDALTTQEGGEDVARQTLERIVAESEDALSQRQLSPGQRALLRRAKARGSEGRRFSASGEPLMQGLPADRIAARREAAQQMLDDLESYVEPGALPEGQRGFDIGEPRRAPEVPESASPIEEAPAPRAEGGAPPAEPPAPPAATGGPPQEPPNIDAAVLDLTETIRKAKRLRPEQQRAFAIERRQRAGKVGGILEGGTGEEAFHKAQGSLRGEFEGHATFEPPQINDVARSQMVEEIRTTEKLRPFEKLNAKQAFDKVMSGRLPEPAELEKLERVFGRDFAQAVLDKAPATWSQLLVDILNAPKALLASFDLSFPLRQGMVLAWSQPKAWLRSWKPMIKAFASDEYAKIADDAMRNDPLFARYMDSGGYHAPLKGGARAQREESFASRIMDWLPGIGGSQRGFITFGNKLRFEAWKNLVDGTTAVGEAQDAVDAAFNQFVRHATGRGDVPFRAGEILPGLSAFFSLRNFVSRFQLLADPVAVKGVPLAVRAKIAGDLAKFFAGGVTFLGLIKLAHDRGVPGFEDVTVAHDPRSTDFGKIRIGDRRYDLWTGYAQMGRYAAQVMSGQRLAELPDDTKALVPIDRKKYALRFIESKLDPTLALALDLWSGETYTGEALKPDLATLRREAFNRLVPLFLQDLTESLKKYGPLGPAFAAPSLIGAGSVDYETSEAAKQYALKQVLPERLDAVGFPSVDRGFQSDYWKSRLPAESVDPHEFDSWAEYRQAFVDYWTEQRPEDMSEAMARDLASRKFDSLPAVKMFHKQQRAAEERFWQEHPDLLQQAIDSNLEDWSKEKEKILAGAR